MIFDWDDAKAQANVIKHRVSFDVALGVFADPYCFEFEDRSMNYGEDRWTAMGLVDDVILVVTYTFRHADGDDVVWLISARRAQPKEVRRYRYGA